MSWRQRDEELLLQQLDPALGPERLSFVACLLVADRHVEVATQQPLLQLTWGDLVDEEA